jgi:signal transduction histidine kinase
LGNTRWIAAMGRCFHNGFHRLLGVTLDVTERKNAAAILEQTVAERTAELHDTISELEAFSYSISHDMRAPLRSMRGYADILMRECSETLTPESRRYLERITSSAERMDRLIQDVLTFSRVARNELTLEPVNLDHLVRGILECYPNLQQPHADIAIEDRLPYVLGNAAALTQCISNLLGNAVKFVAKGTQPRVRLWAEVDETASREQPMVRLYVRDNGIGIAKTAQDKIFGIFQRLNKNYDGTGIGLAVVKKAAERMRGRVGVNSEPGQGSTFSLELPSPRELNRVPPR